MDTHPAHIMHTHTLHTSAYTPYKPMKTHPNSHMIHTYTPYPHKHTHPYIDHGHTYLAQYANTHTTYAYRNTYTLHTMHTHRTHEVCTHLVHTMYTPPHIHKCTLHFMLHNFYLFSMSSTISV